MEKRKQQAVKSVVSRLQSFNIAEEWQARNLLKTYNTWLHRLTLNRIPLTKDRQELLEKAHSLKPALLAYMEERNWSVAHV